MSKVLSINGSSRNDVVTVDKVGSNLKVTENGVSRLFAASKVGRTPDVGVYKIKFAAGDAGA